MKKLKGFTLLELVIVMAIFTGIVVGAMAMIRPAMQLFNKTASQEGASADIDNISRYIQDNLKYADRVNVYYGYGIKDTDAPLTGMGSMLSKKFNTYTRIVKDGNEWKKEIYEAYAMDYFRDYYFSNASEYTEKNAYIMEITQDGRVNIFSSALKDKWVFPAKVSSASDEFYKDNTIKLKDLNCSPPNMNITLEVEYNGVTKESDGSRKKLKQESEIGFTFLNIAQRSEFNVIENATAESGDVIATDAADEYEISNGKVISHPAAAFKCFAPDTLPDSMEDWGNIYIIYTVPEIIIP